MGVLVKRPPPHLFLPFSSGAGGKNSNLGCVGLGSQLWPPSVFSVISSCGSL